MLVAKHSSFNIQTYTGIAINSPIAILDPFDESFENMSVIDDIKHGAWESQTAMFCDSFGIQVLQNRLHVYKCALLLAERACTDLDYIALVETFKGKYGRNSTLQDVLNTHVNNPLISDCVQIVVDYLNALRVEIMSNGHSNDFDLYMSMVFHDAVHCMAIEYSQEEQDFTRKIMQSVGMEHDAAALARSFESKDLPTAKASFEAKIMKAQSALDERYPRAVQYMRIKHVTQADYTPLDSNNWQKKAEFNNDSGQLSILDTNYISVSSVNNLQAEMSQLANDIQLVDGERVNLKMVGSFKHGMNCMTPIRDNCGDIWVIRNDQNEIVEIMVHFDLKST